MPLPILRKNGENTEILRNEPLWKALNQRANNYQTAKNFRRVLSHHALNYGNGFARIDRRGAGPESDAYAFHIIHPSNFVKKDIVRGDAEYVFRDSKGLEEVLKNHQVMHLMNYSDDGLTGIGAIECAKESIAQALAIEAYGATFFGRGGLKAGLLKKVVPFRTDEDRKRFDKDWQEKYRQGRDGFHKNLLVEGDWDYKPIGSDPTEAQLVEARSAMVPEIARFYGLTPHLAGDLSRAHFANVEHLWIEFLNITEAPWMVAWEQEIHRVVLTERQRDAGYYAKHNTASFMRGDFEARMRAYATLLQNGIASINETRALEDWDPVPGGEAHHIQLNMQTVPGTGEPTASEKAAAAKTEKPEPASKQVPAPVAAMVVPPNNNFTVQIADRAAKRRIIRDGNNQMIGIEDID
jgi:HK97 family phage portal protein